jgi:hypothetical protein
MSAPTFPLMMPTTGVAASDFHPVEVSSVNRLKSGAGHATRIGAPYWEANITTANLVSGTLRARKWRSFVDALRGQMKTALLYDADQPYPQNYRSGFSGLTIAGSGTAFEGVGGVDTRVNANEFDISGLPANFQLFASDYIGFVKGGRYWLCRLVSDETANSGGEVTVYVEPSVPPLFDAAATFNLVRPLGEFIVQESRGGRELEGSPMTITAISRAF